MVDFVMEGHIYVFFWVSSIIYSAQTRPKQAMHVSSDNWLHLSILPSPPQAGHVTITIYFFSCAQYVGKDCQKPAQTRVHPCCSSQLHAIIIIIIIIVNTPHKVQYKVHKIIL